MKKFLVSFLFLNLLILSQVYCQTGTKQETAPTKPGQNLMLNDVYAGYGAGSIFYFTGRMKHSTDYPTELTYIDGSSVTRKFTSPYSIGTVFVGYQRSLNRIVTMGFMFGFQNFSYTEYATEVNPSPDGGLHTITNNDILLTGIARVLFSYVNKPVIRMYSGIGIGLTVNFGKATMDNEDYSNNKLWPGGQLTLMGIRFGRSFGGFFEFGFGSYGIVNAGLSYKFAD